jgi:hypothetical protein
MVLKIKSHKKSCHKLLDYMLHDKDRLFDSKGRSFVIAHNLKGNNLKEWEQQFIKNETYRKQKRKKNVFVTHEILSWNRLDAKNMSLEKMEAMAREYINLRNPNGMYIAVPHFDKEHYHVHLCVSGVEYRTGKTLRLSKKELVNVKKGIQDYQIAKYPELSHSIVQHGKKEKSLESEQEYQYRRRTGRESDKSQVIGILKTSYKKALSKTDFFEMLHLPDVSTYSRRGKVTGVVYKGRKFRFNRLGFTDERLNDLDKSIHRGKELSETRGRKGRNIERNI